MHLTVFLFAFLASIGHARRITNGRSQGKSYEERRVDDSRFSARPLADLEQLELKEQLAAPKPSQLLATVLLAFHPVPGMRCCTTHTPPLHSPTSTLHAPRMQFEDYDFGMYGSRTPSEKQLRYAQQLAQQLGKPLPDGASQDADRCSQFIDDCLAQRPARPPSARQIAFAQDIARQTGIELPASATTSAKACSDYISANRDRLPPRGAGTGVGVDSSMGVSFGGAGSDSGAYNMPSQKQILYAAQLAQRLNIGLSAEVLTDKRAMSQFIDECAGKRATAGKQAGSELARPAPAHEKLDLQSQKADPPREKEKIELPYSISIETKVPKYNPQEEPMPF
mmetsp:Transcript_73872/g.135025  ORF Transcript_73872/g.135025 Transcript_73872/m.135025 type:complete len:338 (-) Transcript_73872:14-1027(-)